MWQFDNYLLFGLVLISARPQLLNFTPSPFLSFFFTFSSEPLRVVWCGGVVRESYETKTKTNMALIHKTLTGTLSRKPQPDVPSGLNGGMKIGFHKMICSFAVIRLSSLMVISPNKAER